MKAEHPDIKLITALALTGQALDKFNQCKPEEAQLLLPIAEVLRKITPAWRQYTRGIFTAGEDPNIITSYSQKIPTTAGAVIKSQWRDRYTLDDDDAAGYICTAFNPGPDCLGVYIYGQHINGARLLGIYQGSIEETEEGYRVHGKTAREAARGLADALKTGGAYIMPHTDYNRAEPTGLNWKTAAEEEQGC